jgi:peptide/nickel transport system permease protein
MIRYLIRRCIYGLLVMLGVVVTVFFLFQGFGDPSRLVIGQRADAATQDAIRKEMYLDQPRWKQFIFYLNDISPVGIHTRDEIRAKGIKGLFIGGTTVLAIKWPYLRRSYQSKREVWSILMEALPGHDRARDGGDAAGHRRGYRPGCAGGDPQGYLDGHLCHLSPVCSGISAHLLFSWRSSSLMCSDLCSADWTGLHITGSLFDTDPFAGQATAPAATWYYRP